MLWFSYSNMENGAFPLPSPNLRGEKEHKGFCLMKFVFGQSLSTENSTEKTSVSESYRAWGTGAVNEAILQMLFKQVPSNSCLFNTIQEQMLRFLFYIPVLLCCVCKDDVTSFSPQASPFPSVASEKGCATHNSNLFSRLTGESKLFFYNGLPSF